MSSYLSVCALSLLLLAVVVLAVVVLHLPLEPVLRGLLRGGVLWLRLVGGGRGRGLVGEGGGPEEGQEQQALERGGKGCEGIRKRV